MANFKFVKSATAAVLGASVLTTAVVVPGADASAKTTYKVNKNGTLVNAKTNKAVKGYKTYKGKLYKNGKKFTGKTSSGVYYVKGKKFTGKTKYGYYYVNGKRFTGTTKYGYYYVNGKRFNGKTKYGNLYVDGKRYTGTTKYGYTYYNGKRVEGEYKAKVYTNGKLVTGLYKEKLYNKGVLETGLDLYKDKLYKDGVLNVGYALYNEDLYKDAAKNEGFVADPLKDGKAYNDTKLANGTFDVDGVEKAYEDGVEVGAKVKSVEAINAATLQVTFNKSLDSKTVFTDQAAKDAGTIKTGIVSVGNTDLSAAGYFAELSTDGKTLTFTSTSKATALFTNADKDYVVNVADEKLKTTGGEFIPKFSKLVTVKDTVAPKLVKTTQVNAKKVALQFSEPIDATNATVTATLADGSTVSIPGTVDTKDATVFNLDLAALANGKTAAVKIVGLADYATNVTETNPLTLSVTAGQQDDVAPVVSSITQTGATEFTVKFSEELQNPVNTADLNSLKTLTTLSVQTGGATAITSVKQDTTDKTKYVFTTDKVLDSVTTVSFAAGLTDLSGTSALASSKVVNFTKDTTAPTVSSYQVVKDSTTGKEYLELTFDKNVVLSTAKATATTGTSYVKDYITTAFTGTAADVNYKDVDVSKKVVRVALSDLIGATNDKAGAVYTTALTLAGISSESGTPVTSTTAKFTRGTDTVASGNAKLNVTAIAAVVGDNNKITVKFDKAVDGASATNVANYSVQGAVVESVALGAVQGDGSQTATLTLKKDSNANSGYLNVSVANVQNYDKTRTVEPITQAVNLKENVRPTVTAATLTNTTTITLTFSESVTPATAAEFDVYIGGTKVDPATVSNATTAGKTVAITLPAVTAAQIASGIVVKPNDANATVDANGNALNFTSINVAQ